MQLSNKLSVIYETQILEGDHIVKKNAPKKNLLLDSGLDLVATKTFLECITACALGDGTTPTKRDSGAITVSIASEVATASASFFEAGDVGRLLKLDSGQEVYISGYTSGTQVSVSGATDDAASEFTVWYVDETGHGNELVRTNTAGTDTGDNQSSWDGSTLELKKTFIFPIETEARTYREIGWSHSNTSNANLFGRDVIAGGGDSISSGQQYKVILKLQISPSPTAQQAILNIGNNGFDTSGNCIVASIEGAFDNIANTFGDMEGLEPSASFLMKFYYDDFTLPTAPLTGTDRKDGFMPGGTYLSLTASKDSYVANSHEMIVRRTLATTEGNGQIYGLGLHARGGDDTIFTTKFDNPQTKDSDHTLEIAFRLKWGRNLVN